MRFIGALNRASDLRSSGVEMDAIEFFNSRPQPPPAKIDVSATRAFHVQTMVAVIILVALLAVLVATDGGFSDRGPDDPSGKHNGALR